MLDRREEAGAKLDGDSLKEVFQRHLEELKRFFVHAPHIESLHLNYCDILNDPSKSTKQICEFLNRQLDSQSMAEVVRPDLHRNRS